eukprot:Plantae.Rhodophyta-Hildenbrandia_rubra.ctg911.p1 GENE.Plantae.Rhodophyta-Hildenbrandia_rubra.ctg911~~Plantae.Rhodophyta-Hildenbrandia_rubra.ctg911.p1  ORF type:complete len:636 (+),score=82.20 Plantae.Rhodophyta-Hildenbrandia_rubra.ctg911:3961-5868(+)
MAGSCRSTGSDSSTYSDLQLLSTPTPPSSPPPRPAPRSLHHAESPNSTFSGRPSSLSSLSRNSPGPSPPLIQTQSDSPAASIPSPAHCAAPGSSRVAFLSNSHQGSLVDDVLQSQQAVLAKRRMPLGQLGRRMKKRALAASGRGIGSQPVTMEGVWEAHLSTLRQDFFSSGEAALGGEGKGGKGVVLYEGLGISEGNNKDIKRVYDLVYRVKHNLGQSTGSYEGFRSAIGQFCRAYVSLRKKDSGFIYGMWKEGAVFEMMTDIQLVEAFINYFIKQAKAATVRSKATHLKKLGGFAQQLFTAAGAPEKSSKVAVACEYLLGISGAQKIQARREHRARKSEAERVARGEFLAPADFATSSKTAKDCMDGIMRSYERKAGELGRERAGRWVGRKKDLINKWSINLISFLILQGGGQRPQVCSQLQLPGPEELTEMKVSADKEGVFELRTVLEKTPRALDCSNALFPKSALRYVKFHSQIIRPRIIHNCRATEEDNAEKCLLAHTRSGESLDSSKITKTLRRFLTSIDSELKNVTTMSIRGCYATMMLKFYRDGKIFKDKTEEQFLELLGKMMSTSVEQLVNAYASNREKDFRSAALKMSLALESCSGGEGSRDDASSGGLRGSESLAAEDWAESMWE